MAPKAVNALEASQQESALSRAWPAPTTAWPVPTAGGASTALVGGAHGPESDRCKEALRPEHMSSPPRAGATGASPASSARRAADSASGRARIAGRGARSHDRCRSADLGERSLALRGRHVATGADLVAQGATQSDPGGRESRLWFRDRASETTDVGQPPARHPSLGDFKAGRHRRSSPRENAPRRPR
jgi:hypothetical protein